MACEQAKKELAEAKDAWLDVGKRLLNEVSPYQGRVTMTLGDEAHRRLKDSVEEWGEAFWRFHRSLLAFFEAQRAHR